VLQDRFADWSVSFEHWTDPTVTERLRAGARSHFPFVPTNSLAGSSIGPSEATATVDSPFGEEDGVVASPLSPDVSLVHGVAADRSARRPRLHPHRRSTADERSAERGRLVKWSAKELAGRAPTGDHEMLFCGIGVSHLASWASSQRCELTDRDALPLPIESGTSDFDPPRNHGFIFVPRALPTAI
jgi:hypothetical protein